MVHLIDSSQSGTFPNPVVATAAASLGFDALATSPPCDKRAMPQRQRKEQTVDEPLGISAHSLHHPHCRCGKLGHLEQPSANKAVDGHAAASLSNMSSEPLE